MRHFLLFISALAIFHTRIQAQQLFLKNATVIDGDANIPPRQASLLISNGVIKKIFYNTNPVVKNARVIDCSGKFITPGLMDAHVHLATVINKDTAKAHLYTDSILHNLVRHGITSVRDMAGEAPYLAACKKRIGTGVTTGPDIFYAAQFAGPGYFDLMRRSGRDGELLGKTAWYRAIYPGSNIPQAVAEAKAAGVTGLKIYADLSAEMIQHLTAEAHRQGLQAWSHAAVFPCKPDAIVRAGVNSMSHANDLSFQQLPGDSLEIGKAWGALYKKDFKLDTAVQLKLLKEMARKNIFLDPTVFHAENNRMYNAAVITRLAHQQGVQIVAGTDWIFPVNGEVPLMEELLLLAGKCGLSPLAVIQAATLNGARVCGLKDRGTVRAGMRADLLIHSGDPLKDLRTLFNPEQVLVKGRPLF